MVIPSIPMLLRASFTSSSLKGWIMASIFFMASPLRLEYITLFVVLAVIETLNLLFLSDPQPYGGVDDLENDERPHNAEHPGDRRTDDLIEHLAAVAVHESERLHLAGRVLQSIVNHIRGEDAGQDRAQGSAGAVNAEGVQRVVVAELGL